jgi:V/A-type H+-transporting ATPase subunit A
MLNLALDICHYKGHFEDFNTISTYYKKLINTFKQLNYSVFESDDYRKYTIELEASLA